MEARYPTDETGKRIGVLIDLEKYERLREIEDEMKDVRRYDAAVARRGRRQCMGASETRDRARTGGTQAAR